MCCAPRHFYASITAKYPMEILRLIPDLNVHVVILSAQSLGNAREDQSIEKRFVDWSGVEMKCIPMWLSDSLHISVTITPLPPFDMYTVMTSLLMKSDISTAHEWQLHALPWQLISNSGMTFRSGRRIYLGSQPQFRLSNFETISFPKCLLYDPW